MEWFDRLKRAKELLSDLADKGADHVKLFSNFLREVADATDKAVDAFKGNQQGQQVSLGSVHTQELEAFVKECQDGLHTQGVSSAEASGWQEVGLALLIDLVSRLIKRYKEKHP